MTTARVSIAPRGKESKMEDAKLKSRKNWFRVHSLRKIDDPSGRIDRREMVVALDQFPFDIGLGPNPRRPDPKSRVAKEIRKTLDEDGPNFHLLNRGITILAKDVEYDNKTERVRLRLHDSEAEEENYGILDGGNTYAQINDFRQEMPDDGMAALQQMFVNAQVLVPRTHETETVAELLNDIKEARNNSVQVKQKSLADARHHYDRLKQVIESEPYFKDITWREGDNGSIDVLTILMQLMLFVPRFSEDAPDKEPNGAYGRKEKCLEAFLAYSDDPAQAPLLAKYIDHVPNIVRLFDEMQLQFPAHVGGRFGGINEVRIFDEKKQYEKGTKKYRKSAPRTAFLQRDMKYEYPTGWLFPLLAAFRVLLTPSASGELAWKRDPLKFWKNHGAEICNRYDPFFKAVGYDAKRLATSATTYASMRAAVTDIYKSELLEEAGIAS
jgi:hypothetical protein